MTTTAAPTDFARYLVDKVSPSSAATYARIESVWTRDGASSNNPASVIAWFNAWATADKPAGTVQSYRAAVVRLGQLHGLSAADVAPQLVKRKWRQRVLRDSLTDDAVRAYLAAVRTLPAPSCDVLAILPFTGLRISEACSLRLDQIEPHGALLIARVVGKGDKPRPVPIVNEARTIVERAVQSGRVSRSPWLFPSAKSKTEHAKADTVRAHLRGLRDGTVFDATTPHVLRHTAATIMLRAGVNLANLQAVLGHSDITTTQRYLHPGTEDLAEALGKIKF